LLEKELADLFTAVDMMYDGYDIDEARVDNFRTTRRVTVQEYLHHNKHLFGSC